jgi:hypothetical protein
MRREVCKTSGGTSERQYQEVRTEEGRGESETREQVAKTMSTQPRDTSSIELKPT